MRCGVGARTGIICIVNGDMRRREALAWPVGVRDRDEILDDVQISKGLVELHECLPRMKATTLGRQRDCNQ